MQKRTVGIITYHNHENYGTMLQALALQEAVLRQGLSVEIIDFFQPNKKTKNDLIRIRTKRIFHYIVNIKEYSAKLIDKCIIKGKSKQLLIKKQLFSDFYSSNITLSKVHYKSSENINQYPPIYDIYMVGSDQTWNPYVGGNPDAFYLTFAPRDKKRVSYAPSVSVKTLTDEQARRMKALLNNVEELSCREEDGAELLQTITGRKVTRVLDPTFLLSSNDWDRFAKPVDVPEKYILQYLIGTKPEHREYIKRLSNELKIPIVSIPCTPRDMVSSYNKKWCGPGEFLTLIKNAYVICTDSFHGAALSINYRRNVISFLKTNEKETKSENSRIENLYRLFGIEGRIIYDTNQVININRIPINYYLFEDRIIELVADSENYLSSILRA